MRRERFFGGALMGMLALLSGCAARRAAEDLVVNVGHLTLEYEQVRDAKVEAEKKFYAEQKETLSRIWGKTSAVTDPQPRDSDIKKTIAYGRIVMVMEQDAVAVAESFVASPGVPQAWSGLTDFLAKGLNSDLEVYLEARRRQEQLNISLVKELVAIDQQTEHLENIRASLLELEKNPTLESRLKQFFNIGAAVRKQLQTDTK